MTENFDTSGTAGSVHAMPGTTPADTGESKKDLAKQEAASVGQDAKQSGQHVASVAKDEAKNVTAEASQQAKQLWQQTRSELVGQTSQQQQRLAGGLRTLGDELGSMARNSDQSGVATDLANQASTKLSDVASWLENREPGGVVDEVKRFARNKPGTFLAVAAGIGLLGGRLSRGLAADAKSGNDSSTATGYQTGPAPTTSLPAPTDHSTSGYSAYGSPADATRPGPNTPVAGSQTMPSAIGEPVYAEDALSDVDPVTGARRTGAGADTYDTGSGTRNDVL